MGYLDSDIIASNKLYTVADATSYEFGVITSIMHMSWMRMTCGRLESRYQYSSRLCYNNFPWPKTTEKKRKDIEAKASEVLKIRESYSSTPLSDLYDPRVMPLDLLKAHESLDKTVDSAYSKRKFSTEIERTKFLFDLHFDMIDSLP